MTAQRPIRREWNHIIHHVFLLLEDLVYHHSNEIRSQFFYLPVNSGVKVSLIVWILYLVVSDTCYYPVLAKKQAGAMNMGVRSTLEINLHFNLVVQNVPLLGAED